MGAPITENIGNLGKLKEAVTLKRSMLTEIPYIGGRDFYPDLANVGKYVIEGEAKEKRIADIAFHFSGS